jgi:spermidine/putrescine transport system ATP-binding protein
LAQTDVRLDRVTKLFQDVTAVDDLSIDIERGEFFSLLGPSGCGKTTTLRLIAGFEDVTAGTVWLGDQNVTELPPFKRDVNTVFQNYALFPHLNVFENVAFGLRRRKVGDAEIKRRVAEMLEMVELPGYEHRRTNQLSGGQQQRVALARALINGPRVLLLDEPLGALDLKLRRQMQLELKNIQSNVGITFVFVTHDQEEAMTMSNRIAVMRDGKVEQLGSPEDLYERPATPFVANFLGVSNLLDGKVVAINGAFADVELGRGQRVRVPAEGCRDTLEVTIGVRPEKLRLVAANAGTTPSLGSNGNSLEGRITAAGYLGVSTQYEVRLDDGFDVTIYTQNLDISSVGEQLAPGERVHMTWKPEHTFVIKGRVKRVPVGGSPDV